MNRRSFLKLSPAFPVAATTAALVVREKGKPDIPFDVSILKVQAGDAIVLSAPSYIPPDTAERLDACIRATWPGVKALVMGDGLKVDGVLRVETDGDA